MPKLMQRLKYRFTNGLSNINFPDCHNVLDIIIDTFTSTILTNLTPKIVYRFCSSWTGLLSYLG